MPYIKILLCRSWEMNFRKSSWTFLRWRSLERRLIFMIKRKNKNLIQKTWRWSRWNFGGQLKKFHLSIPTVWELIKIKLQIVKMSQLSFFNRNHLMTLNCFSNAFFHIFTLVFSEKMIILSFLNKFSTCVAHGIHIGWI